MKTTDSVKDKFIKWLVEESGEPEHLVMLMQSVYVNPESMFKFYSHSLAEARREWVEEIKKKISQCKQAPGMSCEYCSALYDVLSILNPLSEHDQELIREGRAMSDFDTRRGE